MTTVDSRLTEADSKALSRMPDDWFVADSLWPAVYRAQYRCERLNKLGYLEWEVRGEYPHLESWYKKKPMRLARERAVRAIQNMDTSTNAMTMAQVRGAAWLRDCAVKLVESLPLEPEQEEKP